MGRQVYCAENLTLRELHFGFVSGSTPAGRLSGRARKDLAHWRASDSVRVSVLGPVPEPYFSLFVDVFRRSYLRTAADPRRRLRRCV